MLHHGGPRAGHFDLLFHLKLLNHFLNYLMLTDLLPHGQYEDITVDIPGLVSSLR